MSKTRGIPISSLGRPALLQLQAQGFDVSKFLNAGLVLPDKQPGNKYHVSEEKDRMCDGKVFASKLERNVYQLLTDRHIEFKSQVPYVLEEAFEHEGKKYRAVVYVSDFDIPVNGKWLVVDTKGFATRMFELKRKLMLLKHGIKIIQIKNMDAMLMLLHENGLLNKKTI